MTTLDSWIDPEELESLVERLLPREEQSDDAGAEGQSPPAEAGESLVEQGQGQVRTPPGVGEKLAAIKAQALARGLLGGGAVGVPGESRADGGGGDGAVWAEPGNFFAGGAEGAADGRSTQRMRVFSDWVREWMGCVRLVVIDRRGDSLLEGQGAGFEGGEGPEQQQRALEATVVTLARGWADSRRRLRLVEPGGLVVSLGKEYRLFVVSCENEEGLRAAAGLVTARTLSDGELAVVREALERVMD